MTEQRNVDIAAVAEHVGLSRTTVSYVLSGKHHKVKIAAKTAQRVREAAKELGYRSNFWAKSLGRQRSNMFGVMFPDLSGSAAHQITKGIQEVLDSHGYEPILAVSFWESQKERREVELLLEKRVEGIIALPQADSQDTFQTAIDAGCPVVLVADWLVGLNASSVTLDPEDAIFKLLDHLHSIGRRNIQLLSVQYASQTLREREEAFLAGLTRLGLPGGREHITHTDLADEKSVCQQVNNIISLPNRPDALLCISDPVGLTALSELARMGVSVPQDLAVASIGNLQFTDHPFFSLTTVDECRKEIGRQAANLMFRAIEQGKPEHIRIKGPLIARQSTLGNDQSKGK